MNLWQKRILKFSLKILGVIILIAVIALFLYYHFYFKRDNLMKYVPQDAAVYATFRLNEQVKEKQTMRHVAAWLQEDFNLQELDFNLLNNFVNYNSAIAIFPRIEGEDLFFDYLLIFNLKEGAILPADYTELFKTNNFYYKILKIKALERNILLLSNSAGLIEKVRKTANLEIPSLANKVETVINLEKLGADYTGKFYVNFRAFDKFLPDLKNEKTKLLLFTLRQPEVDQLFLGLKLNQDNLVIESPFKDLPKTPFLINRVPADMLISFSFINGREQILKLEKRAEDADFSFFSRLKKDKEEIEKLYNFDFKKDLLSLFAGWAQIILIPENGFIIAVKADEIGNLALKLDKIEQIVKEYLGTKYPIEKKKQLADYTYITQIVKNSEIPDFATENYFGTDLKIIRFQNEEFAYFFSDDVLFFANHSDKLKEVIKDSTWLEINEFSSCFRENLPELSQKISAKGEYLSQFWPKFKYFRHIVINESLTQDNAIWLCLE